MAEGARITAAGLCRTLTGLPRFSPWPYLAVSDSGAQGAPRTAHASIAAVPLLERRAKRREGHVRLTVVGIGADGLAGLTDAVRAEVLGADVVLGGARQLGLLPDVAGQRRQTWPSPLRDGLPPMMKDVDGQRVVALASGDPMLSGIGTTLVEILGADHVTVIPHVSSAALARARLGWSAESTTVVSVVGRDVHAVLRELAPGRRVLVLSSDENTPGELAALLTGARLRREPADRARRPRQRRRDAAGHDGGGLRRGGAATECRCGPTDWATDGRLGDGPSRRGVRERRAADQARSPGRRTGPADARAGAAAVGRRRGSSNT